MLKNFDMMNSNAIIEYIVKGKKKKDFFFFLYYSNIPPIRLCSIKIRKEITFGFLHFKLSSMAQVSATGLGRGLGPDLGRWPVLDFCWTGLYKTTQKRHSRDCQFT